MVKRGHKRRLEAPLGSAGGDEPPRPPDSEYSNLGTHLLKQWCWGLVAATDVQRIAMAAYRDGLRHREISHLASLGSWGNYPGNIHGQLATFLGKNWLPEPLVFPVSCIDPKTTQPTEASAAALLPHEWFSALYHRHPAEFQEIFGIERLRDFWDNASRM
eukprot:4883433-Pyramimonas_sp.AAC.1